MIGEYVSIGIVTVILLLASSFFGNKSAEIYAKLNVASFSELWNLSYSAENDSAHLFGVLYVLGLWLCLLFAAGISIFGISENFYSAMEVNTIDKNNRWFTSKNYSFPWSSEACDSRFTRIIGITVNQGIFDKIFNTGSLTVELLTLKNSGSKTFYERIPYIEDPYSVKKRILEGLPDDKSMSVRMEGVRQPSSEA